MYFLDGLKQKITEALNLEVAVFSYPPNSSLGDLSLACFDLAKKNAQSPVETAARLALELKNNKDFKNYFSDIRAVGPYLNFFVAPAYLAENIITEIKKAGDKYGSNLNGHGERVMIEFSNGNTHKEYHVGHLRNISYGDAITRLLSFNGYTAIPVSYINDFGIHTAKTIWNWQRDLTYRERPEPKGFLLGRCYAKSGQALEDNPEGKEAVSTIMKEIESRQGDNYKLWEKTRQWSIDYFASIYQELGIKFTHIFYESEVIAAGLKIVDDLFKKKIIVKSEGAIIANLEQYDLGVLPIIRSDGTALYPVADLALASKKFTQYKLDQSIYVIDVRQSLYFKQLCKVLALSGYQPKVFHLSYDFVTLPEGMMSSRTGNVITYQELRDTILEKFITETIKRHDNWSTNHISKVALNLTIATIKFEMLKVSADKIITFNINEAARFDGYTACYLQYAYARLRSIVRKGSLNLFFGRLDFNKLTELREKELLLKLARYPEIVASATVKYNPSEITKYLFELMQLSNDYYHEINILKSAAATKKARLVLVRAVSQVLQNGLALLGIKTLEEM